MSHPIDGFTGIVHPDVKQYVDKLVGDGLAADGNKDGVVSFAEALPAGNEHASERRVPIRLANHAVPLSLDEDGDGVVSEVEFERAVVRACWIRRSRSEIRASCSSIKTPPSRCATASDRKERIVSAKSECGPLNE